MVRKAWRNEGKKASKCEKSKECKSYIHENEWKESTEQPGKKRW